MNRSTFSVFGLLFAVLLCVPANADTFTFTTLDDPSAAYSTNPCGISGNNIVGYYWGLEPQGFIYNGSTYTTINDPLALGGQGTWAQGISGSNVVGYYVPNQGPTQGFIHNGSTYTPCDDPQGVNGTWAEGIDGNNIVGYYWDISEQYHGFIYNGSTYTRLDDPLEAWGTAATGISGNNVVGYYADSSDDATASSTTSLQIAIRRLTTLWRANKPPMELLLLVFLATISWGFITIRQARPTASSTTGQPTRRLTTLWRRRV